MKIVLIGAGNLATNLGKALQGAGHDIVQVWSRTEESAQALAAVLKCSCTTEAEEVVRSADVFVIAVKDSALSSLAASLKDGREGQLFVHTAGSMPLEILPFERRGVLYPMQTFSKNKEVDFSVIPCFVEASGKADEAMLISLSKTISDTVYVLDSENRKYLHLSAVFCCNFANHCFAMGERLLKEHGNLPFSVMLPLIEETASKLYSMSPQKAQTGPAVRWDKNVIDKHLQLLADEPGMQKIYELMSKSIHEVN
ncbi:MAG: DUF2520 domain-containing protein [Bacteroidaceae bacterium]|nr:DUF2520 domain-containing protein [Bacteroidaceae bacterium]